VKDDNFFKVDLFGNNVGATFSRCKKYRYVLYKIWDAEKPRVMFIGLNPSTASHEKPDNTITKVMKIARNNGFGGFYMCNLFAIISSDPKILTTCDDPEGNNIQYLEHYGRHADTICFCWGNFKEAKTIAPHVVKQFPKAFALTILKDGSPKHPLYCKDNTPLIQFNGQAKD
jgi:hypothetical protein